MIAFPDGMDEAVDAETLVAFLNTLDQRTFAHRGQRHEPHDDLCSPAALADWLAERGLTDAGGPDSRPKATSEDLADALTLRSVLRDSLVAKRTDEGQGPGGSDGTGALSTFPLHLAADRAGGLSLNCTPPRPGAVGQALATLVAAAATAGVRGTWHRVRVCAAPDCGWAFADASRRGDKRWCSTAVCGNRRKTADYRSRLRETDV